MQQFTCDCGNTLFFGSTKCPACKKEVGFSPEQRRMVPITSENRVKRCANGEKYGVCNWLVNTGTTQTLCMSCRMNQVVPNLSSERNKLLWGKMEAAKRRLLYTLLRLGMTLPTKKEQPLAGLAFEIISTVLNPGVTTGHLNGVITVNLEEADDTYRQINQQQLGESSRTLLGHFRHESAHYMWSRFLSNLDWNDPKRVAFRERFGDEWTDYASSLSTHYQRGAPPDWSERYISAYAASHPWEDWAETWSHYLQMIDGLDTCEAMGIRVQHLSLPLAAIPGHAGFLPVVLPQSPSDDDAFLAMLQRWACISTVLNEISESLGESPLYPFVISPFIAQKLRLAHYFASIWGAAAGRKGQQQTSA